MQHVPFSFPNLILEWENGEKENITESVPFKSFLQMMKIVKLKWDSYPSSAVIPGFLQLFIHIVIYLENIAWAH